MQNCKLSDDLLLTPIDDKDYVFLLFKKRVLIYVSLAIGLIKIQLSARAHLAIREDSEP